jgi:hypothetical protein
MTKANLRRRAGRHQKLTLYPVACGVFCIPEDGKIFPAMAVRQNSRSARKGRLV